MKFGRIITNNSQFSSNLIYNKPELDDTVMKNNKQESLIFEPVTNAPTRIMSTSIKKESNTKLQLQRKIQVSFTNLNIGQKLLNQKQLLQSVPPRPLFLKTNPTIKIIN